MMGTAIALLFFNSLIRNSSALFASSVTYLIPLVALFWGFSDHEQLGIYHLIGLLAILGGVYLINRPENA
jgi:drug/metabolite transporter (DMT)-like permease